MGDLPSCHLPSIYVNGVRRGSVGLYIPIESLLMLTRLIGEPLVHTLDVAIEQNSLTNDILYGCNTIGDSFTLNVHHHVGD